ncbi:hypothetical protein PROFUN_03935 [Planoprotostelium fungivorum]|uniref:Uncharacterized protein n=1 Tax=Planoprotostelium fungivorum TaxID=1890364 RepID=A0A2P6MTR9_9EUKA|nr:hypothetical protein PROFUN_03935 [Planoprotostelium fungivorum]
MKSRLNTRCPTDPSVYYSEPLGFQKFILFSMANDLSHRQGHTLDLLTLKGSIPCFSNPFTGRSDVDLRGGAKSSSRAVIVYSFTSDRSSLRVALVD